MASTLPGLNILIVTECDGVTEVRLFKNTTIAGAINEIENESEEYNASQYIKRIFASSAGIHELPLELCVKRQS